MTEEERIELADILFPNIDKEPSYYEEKYPERKLKEGAKVTRFAPSPTGFMHIGGLESAFLDYIFAKQSGGVFFLRIEDTDRKRFVEGATDLIKSSLESFDIMPEEGAFNGGAYAPYVQSEREEIYKTYIKDMIKKGKAYPCFMTEEELSEIREGQELRKEPIGVYGMYATDRDLSLDEIKEHLKNNDSYVIRMKSPGSMENTVVLHDLIKGDITLP